jgi:hypothetical protein
MEHDADDTGRRLAMTHARAALCATLATLLAGCVGYGPPQLAAMSDVELCELGTVQRVNLTAPTREALSAELARRKVDCEAYVPAIQARARAELYERTYFNQSP